MQQLSLSSINSKHIEEISSSRNEPAWLKQYREKSLAVYAQLPPEVSPLYNKYTDAKRMDPAQVVINLVSDKTVPDFLQKRIDELNCVDQRSLDAHVIVSRILYEYEKTIFK